MTSGSCRRAARRAVRKLLESWPTSRWFTHATLSTCRTSMGSSMVTRWRGRVRLMYSIMAARVVVFPEPVGPVTSTRPRASLASFCTTGRSPNSSNVGPPMRSFRKTMLTPPRCRKTLARNRPTPGTVWAKSTSPSSSKRAFRLGGTMASASRSASWPPTGGCSSRRSWPPSRNAGGDPTLMWRSEPSLEASWRSQSTSSTTVPPGAVGLSATCPVPIGDRLIARHLFHAGHGQSIDLRQVREQGLSLLGSPAENLHALLEFLRALADLPLEGLVLILEPEVKGPRLQQVPDPQERLVVVERLGQEIPRAHRQGPLPGLRSRVGGEDQ